MLTQIQNTEKLYVYTCIDCGETTTYRRAVKNGLEPRCPKCAKRYRNKRDWEKEKARRVENKGATRQQQQWSGGGGAIDDLPRVIQLAPLFLQVTDSTGHAVEHSPAEWLVLAAEFKRLNAHRMAAFCTRKGAK